MSTVLKMNELNQLKKGDKLPCPGVIVRGTVQMQRGKIIKTVQGGSMRSEERRVGKECG